MDDDSDSDKFQIACFVDSSGPTFQLWPMGMNCVKFRHRVWVHSIIWLYVGSLLSLREGIYHQINVLV